MSVGLKLILVLLAYFAFCVSSAYLLCLVLREKEKRAAKRRKEMARNRAPVIHVGDKGSLNGWQFYIKPGVPYFSGFEDGEPRFLGYSNDELDEIAQRPAEFEQPDLKWFCREE